MLKIIKKLTPREQGGFSQFDLPQLLFLCELKPHAKFQEPMITPSGRKVNKAGRKVNKAERKKKEKKILCVSILVVIVFLH